MLQSDLAQGVHRRVAVCLAATGNSFLPKSRNWFILNDSSGSITPQSLRTYGAIEQSRATRGRVFSLTPSVQLSMVYLAKLADNRAIAVSKNHRTTGLDNPGGACSHNIGAKVEFVRGDANHGDQ